MAEAIRRLRSLGTTDHWSTSEMSICGQLTHSFRIAVYSGVGSRCTTIKNTIPTMVNIRNASSCPFHIFDCHIRNHSPPTSTNATNHISRLVVNAITATFSAAANCAPSARYDFSNRTPAHQHRSIVTDSHTIFARAGFEIEWIDENKASGKHPEFIATYKVTR